MSASYKLCHRTLFAFLLTLLFSSRQLYRERVTARRRDEVEVAVNFSVAANCAKSNICCYEWRRKKAITATGNPVSVSIWIDGYGWKKDSLTERKYNIITQTDRISRLCDTNKLYARYVLTFVCIGIAIAKLGADHIQHKLRTDAHSVGDARGGNQRWKGNN